MNNRFFSLLDSRGLASENDTSRALAELLEESLQLRQLFLQFLFKERAGGLPGGVWATAEHLAVVPQYSFSGSSREVESIGCIDLALIAPARRFIIAVQFKVRDRERPGRLRHYRIMSNHEFPGPNWLFEIVQRKEHDIDAAVVDAVLTWNDFHSFVAQNLNAFRNDPIGSAVAEYLEFLKESKTILSLKAKNTRKAPGFAGVPDPDVCRATFLELQRRLLPDCISTIESDRNVPRQLRLGRKSWAEKFGAVWVQRIWLNLRVEPTTGNHFLWAHLIFHHAIFTKFDYAARMLPRWAPLCAEAGMIIRRGPAHGWDGRKGADVNAPWILDCRPKYFHAEESLAVLESASALSNGSQRWMLEVIDRRLPKLLALIDSFPSQ